MQLFAAIDFETATSERTSACAIGYVIFNKTKIIKKVSHLIRPPKPEVHFTDIHGLTWDMLKKAKTFDKVWRQIKSELSAVDYFFAHNAPFDRSSCTHVVIFIISTYLNKNLKTLLQSQENIGNLKTIN